MDGFERARRRIEEFQMNRPQVIYCMVPTGPTAPTGPAAALSTAYPSAAQISAT